MIKHRIFAALAMTMAVFMAGDAGADGPVPPKIESMEEYNGKKIPEFNRFVLEIVKALPADGSHTYNWPKGSEPQHDGVTQDLFLNGTKVLKGDPNGRTFCCGLTLEVFLKAYDKWVEKNGTPENALKPEAFARFKTLWFVEEVNGPGPSVALEKYGLGKLIPKEEALPGDFVQIWRRPVEGKKTGSGHSVIFIDWVKDDAGAINGLRYWSTQTGTDGISENVEYFGKEPKDVGGEISYWARVEIPKASEKPPTSAKEEGPGKPPAAPAAATP